MEFFSKAVVLVIAGFLVGVLRGGVWTLESTAKDCKLEGSFRAGDIVFYCGPKE
jgi:hypothetical protein